MTRLFSRIRQDSFTICRSMPMWLAINVIVGCGGGDENAVTDTLQTPVDAPAVAPPGPAGFTDSDITPQLVASGDSIFKGAGTCFSCHGMQAEGTGMAPSLSDAKWINGDGSLHFIVNTVRNGIAQPKEFPGLMPRFGQSLTEEQLRAVAAYVYSRSHPNMGGGG